MLGGFLAERLGVYDPILEFSLVHHTSHSKCPLIPLFFLRFLQGFKCIFLISAVFVNLVYVAIFCFLAYCN
jgi:hypothetical protein